MGIITTDSGGKKNPKQDKVLTTITPPSGYIPPKPKIKRGK